MELQKKIANAKNMDYDAAEAIKELLGKRPNEVKKDLEDWEVEEFEGKNILFYKGKNYVPIDGDLGREMSKDITTIRWQDTQESFKHSMRLKSIIGGLDYEFLSRTMSRVVELVNSSKLTETQRNLHLCP